MTDLITKLAEITQKNENGLLPCNCGRRPEFIICPGNFPIIVKCQPCERRVIGFLREVIEQWNTRPREAALIALVQEAVGEIERFRKALEEISKHQEYGGYGSGLGYSYCAQLAQKVLTPQEPTS